MSTVAFHTLGCKVNFYDTEGIWQLFQQAGYRQVPFDADADVYVINTCTVTNTGDKKSRQMIRRAVRQNPDATVVVTGCYAQVAPEEVAAIHGVDLVVGNDRKSQMVDLVQQVRQEQHPFGAVGNILKTREFEELDVPVFEDRTRASLKIQDGCNNFCTFCIIPYARGLIRSRRPENILRQAQKLVAAGYREIVLTGIHTGGYGADLTNYRLADLLVELEQIEHLHRIRISSIEASEIDEQLIDVLTKSNKVCRHLHIPLQAGHDQVLRKMNRHYTVSEYADKLEKVRNALPDAAITSDVIVGFPGETDVYFEHTETFIREQKFAQLHVFPYSPRRGTPAAKFINQVDETVKNERVSRLISLSENLTKRYAQSFVGKSLEVIPEGPLSINEPGSKAFLSQSSGGTWLMGHADNYLRVAFQVPDTTDAVGLIGEVCEIQIHHAGAALQGGTFIRQITFAQEQKTESDKAASQGRKSS